MDTQRNPSETTDAHTAPPTGTHALEIAARHGFGPLSPKAGETWHGDGLPCVTCGQLVHRDATACGHCGQNLRPEMLEKMKAHAGPWYVLEHLRPFPGVNLERIVKQIHRGLLTETSIVRGPATNHQWRFALETPGLCRYFGKCWHCFSPVGQVETSCQQCGAYLTFEPQRPLATSAGSRSNAPAALPNGSLGGELGAAPGTPAYDADASSHAGAGDNTASELDHLRAALSQGAISTPDSRVDPPTTIVGIRAGWFAAGTVILILVALWFVSNNR